jgi:hypothetical protein
MPLSNEKADRLFDAMLVRLESRLGRAIRKNFAQLARLMRDVINDGGAIGGTIAILNNQAELAQILQDAYEGAIRDGVRFTRRDLDLPEEEDEDNMNEALLLLLLWRQSTATEHAEQMTQTTLRLYSRFYNESSTQGLQGEARERFVVRNVARRNRGRIRNIATSEAGEALSAGSEAQATLLNDRLVKSWTSQRDRRVRDTHIRADKRYTEFPIELSESFQVGASSGPYPRSSQLSQSERNGCRCYVRYKRADTVQ